MAIRGVLLFGMILCCVCYHGKVGGHRKLSSKEETARMRSISPKKRMADKEPSVVGNPLELGQQGEGCPIETISVRRTNKEDLIRATITEHDQELSLYPTNLKVDGLQKMYKDIGTVKAVHLLGVIIFVAVVVLIFIFKCLCRQPLETLSENSPIAPQQGDDAIEMVPTQSVDTTILVDTFPVHTFPCDQGDVTYGELCVICNEDFTNGESLRSFPKCGHLYHSKCIEGWLNTDRMKQCPHCRCSLIGN